MKSVFLLSALPLLLLSTACDSTLDEGTDCQGDRCDDGADGDYLIAGEYQFCMSPAMATAEEQEIDDAFVDMPLPNIKSLQFMAHLADMAYWDAADLGPELERLGFGKPGDGKWLGQCAADATLLRESSLENPFNEVALSTCALDWMDAGGTDKQSFFRYVEGEVHPDRDIEFFSQGYETLVDSEYERGSTQLFWAKHRTENLVFLAFRGTSDLGDAWVDVNYPTKPFVGALPEYGIVHGGFYDAYRSITNLLDKRIFANIEGSNAPIWVTGHSLGGALASIATAELLVRIERGTGVKVGGMATFGSPRVGDTDFFESAERIAIANGVSLHRVSNISESVTGYDPVVHVPLQATFGEEFKHMGAPIQILENGDMRYALYQSRGIFPIAEAIASLKEHLVDMLSSAFPHALGHYHDRMAKAARGPQLQRCDPR